MAFQKDLFAQQHVLVTGATQGIGAGVANYLASLGARVTAVGLDRGDGSLSAGVRVVLADVSDPESTQRVFDDIDSLDALVNCAGIIRRGAEHQVEVFEKVVSVNLTGTMRMCTASRALLKVSRGAIVNMASMLSFFGGAMVPGYAASKGGVAQLTKSLALAYAGDKIRVNAVAPGWIATPLTQALQDDPARSKPILSRTPLGRWGTPEDVAGCVAFLCSPAAAFMTGVILPVDGGYLVA
ncbi:MAG TPA: SDR family oxidoreductase [Castellaniella sp.]|uniref:SDR family NAD(P)-dependent oxidoreductase n=1 Tax=Castellaniella sp. TaxID=1955812 RepID=UPI002F0638DE